MPIELTNQNFDTIINENDTVIIDFWAPWCGPCQGFAPVFEKTAQKHTDIAFAKVNTEDYPDLSGHFNIRSIPTLVVFREKIIVYLQPGALPESGLENLIQKIRELDMDDVRKQLSEQQKSQR